MNQHVNAFNLKHKTDTIHERLQQGEKLNDSDLAVLHQYDAWNVTKQNSNTFVPQGKNNQQLFKSAMLVRREVKPAEGNSKDDTFKPGG